MKGLLRLDAGTVLPLFGILQRVIRVIMKFVRKGKMLFLKSLKVSMGSRPRKETSPPFSITALHINSLVA
jgi:hypothetical protein